MGYTWVEEERNIYEDIDKFKSFIEKNNISPNKIINALEKTANLVNNDQVEQINKMIKLLQKIKVNNKSQRNDVTPNPKCAGL